MARRPTKNKCDRRTEQEIVEEVHQQLFQDLAASGSNLDEAARAYEYFYARQWTFGSDVETSISDDPEGFQLVVNTVKPDTERKVAKLLDAQPVMVVRGRGADNEQFSETWNDLVKYTREWTGDRTDCWEEVLPRVITQAKITGEGIALIDFDPREEDGWGMVVGRWINALNVVWPPDVRSSQLRDAEHVIWFEPRPITTLEREYPWLKGKIQPQDLDWLRSNVYGMGASEGQTQDDMSPNPDTGVPAILQQRKMAYIIRRWERREEIVTAYRDKESMKPVRIPHEKGTGGVLLTEERWGQLPGSARAALKGRVEEFEVRQTTLWETHVVSGHLVLNDISDVDRSKGGHGHYPFARFSNVWDPRRSRGHGDVAFQASYDDLLSQMATRWVETLMVANAQFLDLVKGAIPTSEQHKLRFIGRRPFQTLQRNPGSPPPQWVGANPGAANLLASGSDFVREIANQASNVYDIHRGGMPYSTSGRGIRSLLAEAAVLENLDRIRMKSFLRQETWLRIALIQQHFRQYRRLQITGEKDTEGYKLHVGDTEERIKAHFGLEEMFHVDEDGKVDTKTRTGLYRNPEGELGRVLPVAEKEVGQFDVRLVLDSGRERNKAEREDMVEMFANVAGKMPTPVIKWMAKSVDAPDQESLAEALEEADEQMKMAQQMDDLVKQTGMQPDQIAQVVQQAVQQQQGGAPEGGPPPPEQGAPGAAGGGAGAPEEPMLI